MAIAGLLLCSCATTAPPIVLDAIGPAPGSHSHGKEGALQVFSSTTEVNDGGIAYFPHTSYRIYSADGRFVKFVRNHSNATDQRAETVVLPVGNYSVTATSEGLGVVKVPVAIRGAQLTAVYLDRTRMREAEGAPDSQLVLFPGGKAVGWRAGLTDAK
jgi:hypothetical protein